MDRKTTVSEIRGAGGIMPGPDAEGEGSNHAANRSKGLSIRNNLVARGPP